MFLPSYSYHYFTLTPLFPSLNNYILQNGEILYFQQDTRSRFDLPKLDLNVLPVYKQGITGKGVRISILDDGIEYTHDDLKNNYVRIFPITHAQPKFKMAVLQHNDS